VWARVEGGFSSRSRGGRGDITGPIASSLRVDQAVLRSVASREGVGEVATLTVVAHSAARRQRMVWRRRDVEM
jgi:hypothetical protein